MRDLGKARARQEAERLTHTTGFQHRAKRIQQTGWGVGAYGEWWEVQRRTSPLIFGRWTVVAMYDAWSGTKKQDSA